MSQLQNRFGEVFPLPRKRGLNAKIAALCKVAPASVSNWFNAPAKVSTISRSHAEMLCVYFQLKVIPLWLAEGVLPKIITGDSADGNAYLDMVARPSSGVDLADRRKVIPITEVVHWLASAAETMDATTRGFVGDSLKAVLLDPTSAQFRADQLTGLLAVRPDIAPGAPKAGSM